MCENCKAAKIWEKISCNDQKMAVKNMGRREVWQRLNLLSIWLLFTDKSNLYQ